MYGKILPWISQKHRNKKTKESEQLEKQIASQQHEIQRLMSQLSDLKSELMQEEEAFQDHEMQIKAQKAPVEAEVDTSEELQATKSQRQGKQRKKAVKSTEKFEEAATNQSKSTRSKLTGSKANNQTSVRGETLRTKQKSGAAAEMQTKPVKTARGPQKKVEEKESNPQESEKTVRGRRKAAATAQTTASQPKNQSQMKTEHTAAGEEAQNAGLRRSKRIASRT